MDDLLQSLRIATSPLHKRLDDLVPAFQPASSRAAFEQYLGRFYAGLSACWPMLDWARLQALSLPDVSRRKARYDAITADLTLLGIQVPPLASFSRSPDPVIVGCLYVLEGSVHGGSYLFARIEASTPEIPVGACRFIEGFGGENKRMWTSFVQWLGSLDHSGGFIEEAGDSAVKAFELFIDSFSSPSPKI